MNDTIDRTVRRKRSKSLPIIMVTLLIVLASACGYLFVQYRQALSKQPKSDKERIAQITTLIGDTVILPSERPTIATVADKRKLAEPQLATLAKNGDELLVYSKARRVILYRPSSKKIVDMFRVQDSPQAQAALPQPATR